MFKPVPIEDQTPDVLHKMYATNAIGPSLLVQEGLPELKQTDGTIINVSSVYGHKAGVPLSAYAASKAAIEQLTRCWALELAPSNVRVNAVAPAPTKTRALERGGLSEKRQEEVKSQERDQIPLARRGEPDEVAAWIIRLADPEMSWITSEIISVDGGLSIK